MSFIQKNSGSISAVQKKGPRVAGTYLTSTPAEIRGRLLGNYEAVLQGRVVEQQQSLSGQ